MDKQQSAFDKEEQQRRAELDKRRQQLQEQVNPKPPAEERERMLNQYIKNRNKKVVGPNETK
jgi:hypothetical protein